MTKDPDSENTVEQNNDVSKEPDTKSGLSDELAKLKNEYLYLRAEFENYKKQAIKERSELIRYGGERLGREILDVLDNFERALETELSSENLESFRKGIQLTASELKNLLTRFGIQEIPSDGKAFDPEIHEALGGEETTQVEPGHIVRVFKKAYKMHDRLLRPGQVIIARPPSEPSPKSPVEN